MNKISKEIYKKHEFLKRISGCSFSIAFQKYLKFENVTKLEAAAEAGISQKTIDRYCNGESTPTINTLVRIFLSLGTSFDVCKVLLAKANISISENDLQGTVYRSFLENEKKSV